MVAIDNNPSILVGRYNTKGAQALMSENKKGYYPKLDLEVNQFFNDTATTEIYTLSLHDALPICLIPPTRVWIMAAATFSFLFINSRSKVTVNK